MQELDFALDGVWASTVGIQLQDAVSFTPAVPRVDTITIPGRSGDLHIDTGAFNNRTGTAKCFLLQANVSDSMKTVMSFLFGTRGYRKLMTSQDTGHYWYARLSNAGELAPRVNLLNPFTVLFDCKPFRMVDGSETLVANQVFTNPTGFDSYPLLYVASASEGAIIESSVGHIVFADAAAGVYIDCEDCVCYNSQGTSQDDKIQSTEFVKFRAGNNEISTSDVTSLQVAPRWRTL